VSREDAAVRPEAAACCGSLVTFFPVTSPSGLLRLRTMSRVPAEHFIPEDGGSTLQRNVVFASQSTRRLDPEEYHLNRHGRGNRRCHVRYRVQSLKVGSVCSSAASAVKATRSGWAYNVVRVGETETRTGIQVGGGGGQNPRRSFAVETAM
jgi:hypothetical protein